MSTPTTGTTTAEPAASEPKPAAEGQPAPAPEPTEPSKPSTSRTLFPEMFGPTGQQLHAPAATEPAPEDAPAATGATETGEPESPTPEPAAPEPEYLDPSSLQGKKVRIKVDGVEMDVPAEALLKNFQLEAHLTRKGQQLAEQGKTLREIRDELLKKPAAGKPTPQGEDAPAEGAPATALERQLAEVRAELAEVTKATGDVRYQNGLKRLDAEIRQAVGTDDFMTYVPQIEEFIRAEVKRGAPREQLAQYDTAGFYRTKYLELKLKGSAGQPAVPSATPPPPGPQKRPAAAVPPIEGAGGPPSGGRTQSDAWQVQYDAAFKKATASGSNADWQDVIRLKRERPKG